MIINRRTVIPMRVDPPLAPARLRRSAGKIASLTAVLLTMSGFHAVRAQCPEEPPLQYFTGAGRVTCPCFVPGEQAGAVFNAPPAHYPLEILRVGIGWGSQFGGTGQSLEAAIHVYSGGLPDPGTPVFTLEGPMLNDGAINQFNLEPLPGEIVIPSGPFTVTLEFLNENAGNISAPSVVHDNNGCQPGKNVVLAMPGGWNDACALGVSGDWLFFVVYRPCVSTTDVGDETRAVSSAPVLLLPARPNPFHGSTELEFVLARPERATVSVYDVTGRSVALLADDSFSAGSHRVGWNGRTSGGLRAPSGAYFVELRTALHRARRIVLITQ